MVDADPSVEQSLELGAGSPAEVERVDPVVEVLLLLVGQVEVLAHDVLGDAPALLAVEAEDQGGRPRTFLVAARHHDELFVEELVGHPLVGQRHPAFPALYQGDLAVVLPRQPADELGRVPDRRREQEQADVLGQQAERQLPDDPALHLGEVVELVHDAGRHVGEVEPVEQPVQEDLGHDDEHRGLGVDLAAAGDQPHVLAAKTPLDRAVLHLLEFLLGQRDQGRRVVGDLPRMERLEEGRLGDQGLARARRRTDEDSLLGLEPGRQREVLDGVGLVGQLVHIPHVQVVARRNLQRHRPHSPRQVDKDLSRFSRMGQAEACPSK